MFDFFRKWFDRQKQRENEYKSLQAKEDAENLIPNRGDLQNPNVLHCAQ